MASYLQVENINKSYGDKILFKNVSFNINEGDKIALIAPNGTGKSTLLSVLAGKDSSDQGGSVKFMKEIKIAFLEQEYNFNPQDTIFEDLFSKIGDLYTVVREYEQAMNTADPVQIEKIVSEMDRVGGWNYQQKINQMLNSMNLPDGNKKMGLLSGGEVKRVAIANILLQEADFLILDEPTNHLDIEIIEFLEEFLQKSKCTLFMVTHDRYFLDRVCNCILELDRGHLFTYKGNYSYFLEKRDKRLANFVAETTKTKNLLRKELEWMRSTPCARAGKAKYRIDAFHDLKDRAGQRLNEKKLKINVQTSRLGKKIIDCKHVDFSYGDRCMLSDFSYNFARLEKIGIVGANGVGKSTFLNLLTDKVQATSGIIERGETLVFGYYHQSGIKFKTGQTVFDVVHDIAETVKLGDGTTVSVATFLNYFLFPPNTHYVKVEKLSGGERRRLYLLTILMHNPNFLILDEPTNDLDIMTLNVLEDYLMSFPGCLVVVSHDRFFLDKLVDHLFIFQGEGRVKDYVGRCSEYRSFIKDYEAKEVIEAKLSRKGMDAKSCPTHIINEKRRLSYKEKHELEVLEKDIDLLNKEKAELETSLNSGTLSVEKLTKSSKRFQEIIEELDTKEYRWLELSEI
ncbi:MAG: ABC-F family ATP-binding cassette domain-containing protein [Bacteroidales bacterium]